MNKWCLGLVLMINQLLFQLVDAKSRIIIEVPSLQQETAYVWQTITGTSIFLNNKIMR